MPEWIGDWNTLFISVDLILAEGRAVIPSETITVKGFRVGSRTVSCNDVQQRL